MAGTITKRGPGAANSVRADDGSISCAWLACLALTLPLTMTQDWLFSKRLRLVGDYQYWLFLKWLRRIFLANQQRSGMMAK